MHNCRHIWHRLYIDSDSLPSFADKCSFGIGHQIHITKKKASVRQDCQVKPIEVRQNAEGKQVHQVCQDWAQERGFQAPHGTSTNEPHTYTTVGSCLSWNQKAICLPKFFAAKESLAADFDLYSDICEDCTLIWYDSGPGCCTYMWCIIKPCMLLKVWARPWRLIALSCWTC